ncbi:bifunctional oligoribonuclease/PAP phosphatase NrnA [uncultured Selenomonas sp.]|uniref:DHH family phosphoesterase n=1 Tax=uncultured Selenomonas sp. TaxID=159275 RepID=UPI0028EF75F5|nr:bifunctional oligoribonuclease/PAP phosphatase NrnA [uncultured Selenomonas sp.]
MRISLKEAGTLLQEAQNIVITAHVNPDGDAIGSSLGVMHYLRDLGKQVRVVIDDDIPRNFAFLNACDIIEKPTAAETGEKEPIDLLLILDTSIDRTGDVMEAFSPTRILNIDHHVTNSLACPAVYLDADSAATAEIIYQLLQEMNAKITKDIAMAVYTGLATDTGFFRFPNTTPFTMRAAADLLERGAEPGIISEAVEAKPFVRVIGMAKALEGAELLFGGKLAGIFLDRTAAESLDSTEGLIDSLRVIEGTDVSVLLKWKEDGVFRVSMRSKKTNVSKVAAAFSGGGHERAAGCTLKMNFIEAKRTILEALEKAMET